ncbi:MAG: spore germination protein [Candidatus Limiplasma sp.]|nr:spore germination protein [Candidatus Limiplasma sp.]
MARKAHFLYQLKGVQHGNAHEELKADEAYPPELSKKLQENIDSLKGSLGDGNDVKEHLFRFGSDQGLSGALVFIDGLVNNATLTDAILRPLQSWRPKDGQVPPGADLICALEQQVLCAADTNNTPSLPELVAGCLMGDTVLLVDGCASGLVISTKGWEKRSVSEPQTETVVRGPREGFTENLRTNTAMVRRKIRNGRLRVEQMTVGRKTRTGVCLMYLEDVANPKVVELVKYRIGKLDVESVLETGYLEEYIEDAPFSPFSTIGYSEKPDVVSAKILEGRVAILVDGTPFALTAPMVFMESFQTAEDYYARSLYTSLVRMLRIVAYLLSVFAPAIYIALNAFHHELIPTTLLFTIAKAREGTPFPVFVEALIMVFAFELLREAGVRLPRPVGQAISIVGALIMGEAAVSAGLVGAPMVIAIAVTAVAGFLTPSQNDSSSILRVIMMVPAAIVGFYGVGLGCLAMLIHLATLESFGVPYFEGFEHARDAQDTLVRMPLWSISKRPRYIAQGDTTRGLPFIPPLRPHASREEEKEP